MADLNIHVDIRVTPRLFRFGVAGALISLLAPELGSESVTLTTYYPAPSGVYTQMITTGNTFLARDGGTLGIGTSVALGAGDKVAIMGGNVGIGTTDPAASLDIAQNNALKVGQAYFSSGGDSAQVANNAWYNGSAWQYPGGSGAIMELNGQTMIFNRHDGASVTESMRIDSSGRLGVGVSGVTGPKATLDVGPAGSSSGVIILRQTGCSTVAYVGGGPEECAATFGYANTYATLVPGLYVKQWELGNISATGPTSTGGGTMFCCPYPSGGQAF